jgi:hypothetical protein
MIGVRFPAGKVTFLFAMFRLSLGPMQPPVQCALDALSLAVKQLQHEADRSLPFSAMFMNIRNCISICPCFHGVVLNPLKLKLA